MQMQLFGPQQPEMTEKHKTSLTLEDFCFNADRLREVLRALQRLLDSDLLTTVECQMKADKAIEDFNEYIQKGGEGY